MNQIFGLQKIFCLLLVSAVGTTCLIRGRGKLPADAAVQEPAPTLICRLDGYVTGNGLQTISLYATFRDKSLFARDIKIVVQDQKSESIITEISPQEDSGYLPNILLADFTGDGIQDIYLGIDSGGSGGFCLGYVYTVTDQNTRTIFDFAKVPMPYSAVHPAPYKLQIDDNSVPQELMTDISSHKEVFTEDFCDRNVSLDEAEQAEISAINRIFPFYVSTDNRFHLLVMRRICGLCQTDCLGYMQDFMRWDGDAFMTYYQCVCTSGNR